ncbi:MAG: ATP-binding protein [Bacillota bacterium]
MKNKITIAVSLFIANIIIGIYLPSHISHLYGVVLIVVCAYMFGVKVSVPVALICAALNLVFNLKPDLKIFYVSIGFIVYMFLAIALGLIFDYLRNKGEELKLTLERYRKSEERLSKLYTAVEHSSSTILITDSEGNIEYANPYFSELTGYSLEEAIGSNPRILKSGRHDRRFYKKLWSTILAGEVWRGELCNRKKNGELYWELASISPIRSRDGEITHFVAVKENITSMKLKEAELSVTKLEAQEANKAKSEFLANISHELRTPLNGIIGTNELLSDTELNEKQRHLLNMNIKSANDLLEVINNILDMSELEAGRFRIKMDTFNIRQFMEETIEGFSLKARKKGLGLEYNISRDIPAYVIGDTASIRQIIINLLDNAIKFTDKGKVSVFAALHGENIDNIYIILEIVDTGIGIEKDKLSNIFKSFKQGDGTYIRKYPGAGLGLTITKRLIDMLGGEISVDSINNNGSTFTVILPFKKVFLCKETSLQERMDNNENIDS